MKNWLINGALAVGSVALFIGGVEFALRITGLQTVKPNPPKIYQTNPDPRISYELKPNLDREPAYKAHVSTDANGFRLNNESRITNNELPIVALLGDSVTFGYGVDDDQTLAAQLEPLVPTHRILNAAVPGYSLPMEAAAYETKIAELKPEAVMLVFFWNDLDGTSPGKLDDIGVLRAHDWQPGRDDCMPVTEGILSIIPRQCWLDSHSALYKALVKLVNRRAGTKALKIEKIASRDSDFIDPASPEKLSQYERELIAFNTLLPRNMKKIFVIWPDRYIHASGLPAIQKIARNRGFAVINLYERFGNEAETLPWDTVHPSAETIKEAAMFIAEKLRGTL